MGMQASVIRPCTSRGIRSVSAYALDIIHGERDPGLSQPSEGGKHPIHFCRLGGAGWQALQILVLVPHEFLCCCRQIAASLEPVSPKEVRSRAGKRLLQPAQSVVA